MTMTLITRTQVLKKVQESDLETLKWSGLVDQQNVDRLTGQIVIFDILEPPTFKEI